MSKKEPSYVKEMLFSQWNVYALLLALASGAVMSIPWGFGVGLLPLIAFAAGDAIAALFIPFSEGFRARVDRRLRREAREAQRNKLLAEIERREASQRGSGSLRSYTRMVQRVQSLYSVAADGASQLSERDVERLDDATLDYLCMWLAAQIIDERARSINLKDIENRLRQIDRDLEAPQPGADAGQLRRAQTEYTNLITRHRRMLSRKTAIEAAIVSMPDQMDEIYQSIVAAPGSAELGSRLAESIARLALEEDLEAEMDGMLSESVPQFVPRHEQRTAQPARAAAAQAVRQG